MHGWAWDTLQWGSLLVPLIPPVHACIWDRPGCPPPPALHCWPGCCCRCHHAVGVGPQGLLLLLAWGRPLPPQAWVALGCGEPHVCGEHALSCPYSAGRLAFSPRLLRGCLIPAAPPLAFAYRATLASRGHDIRRPPPAPGAPGSAFQHACTTWGQSHPRAPPPPPSTAAGWLPAALGSTCSFCRFPFGDTARSIPVDTGRFNPILTGCDGVYGD